MRSWSKRGVLVLAGVISLFSVPAYAQTLQSPNFQFDETSIGTSGLQGSESASYSIDEATGDLAVGESSSSNFTVDSGSKTTNDPYLSFAVTKSDASFAPFSASQTSTATAEFSVRNYTSWGYSVQVYGSPPQNGDHTIDTIADTPTTSQPGVEQFGINLVANTAPQSVGTNPDNGDFGNGEIGTGAADTTYSTSNRFFYRPGDTIASAPKSSGRTDYTISYIANVTGTTPGGVYKADQMLVVVGKY